MEVERKRRRDEKEEEVIRILIFRFHNTARLVVIFVNRFFIKL
jgi:hypothetical protein